MHKNIFLEIKDQSGPWPMYMGRSLRTRAKACMHRHIPVYTARVSGAWKMQVFYNNG